MFVMNHIPMFSKIPCKLESTILEVTCFSCPVPTRVPGCIPEDSTARCRMITSVVSVQIKDVASRAISSQLMGGEFGGSMALPRKLGMEMRERRAETRGCSSRPFSSRRTRTGWE